MVWWTGRHKVGISSLNKAEASRRIDGLQARTACGHEH
jgi:hypothetical protein